MEVTSSKVRELAILNRTQQRLVAWWYGGIQKNNRLHSVPKCAVFFRQLNHRGEYGDFIQKPIAITHLGRLRIGTIWENGFSNSELAYKQEIFDVNFDERGWKYSSPSEKNEDSYNGLISNNDYPLRYQNDRNWLINFKLPEGKNLLVPCLEYFYRCYGVSARVVQVLATFPWNTVREFLYDIEPAKQSPDYWYIKLRKRTYNGDALILAHMHYDHYSRDMAKSIYAQLESQYNTGKALHHFIKVGPWFKGPARLAVEGKWINHGKTFLALRIVGSSEPGGVPIKRDRDTPGYSDDDEEEHQGQERREKGWFNPWYTKPPVVNMTSESSPGHNTPRIRVVDQDFLVLGERRVVYDAVRNQDKEELVKRQYDNPESDPDNYSTGDTKGTSKKTGRATVTSEAVMQSQGALMDMWNTSQYLLNRYQSISAAWSYTPENGAIEGAPELVSFPTFTDEELEEIKSITIKNWIYSDVAKSQLRGLLVVEFIIQGAPIYLFEIQRRNEVSPDELLLADKDSDSFKGLVFSLANPSEINDFINEFTDSVRYTKGVFHRMAFTRLHRYRIIKHTRRKTDNSLHEGVLADALAYVAQIKKLD